MESIAKIKRRDLGAYPHDLAYLPNLMNPCQNFNCKGSMAARRKMVRDVAADLGKPPFCQTVSVAELERGLDAVELLQVVTYVLAELDGSLAARVCDDVDGAAERAAALLEVLGMEPEAGFAASLARGDRDAAIPALGWVLARVPLFKKRVYDALWLKEGWSAPHIGVRLDPTLGCVAKIMHPREKVIEQENLEDIEIIAYA